MSLGKWSIIMAAGLVLAWRAALSLSPEPSHLAPQPSSDPVTNLFSGKKVLAFSLTIPAAGLQSLRQQPRQWVSATLRTGNDTYSEVAVHIKGSQGSLQGIDERPALTISFTHSPGGRKFCGLRKIHFNNCAEDPSFMTEILCSELCRQAGLPAARSTHATLSLNGRALGLYVLKEGLTKDFLKQFFTRTDGNLYDGGFRRDINRPLERIGGTGPDTQADRLALLAAAREPNPERRWARLKQVLDTDRFISLLAMTTILWNWDGYPMAANNYRIYHDPLTDRLVFIPHGLDQMFWEPQGTIFPPMRGLVATAVLRIPEARQLYLAQLASLHTNVFRIGPLQQRIDELTALIHPYRPDSTLQGAHLKQLTAARWKSIARQLRTLDAAQGPHSDPAGAF
jgi:spore coat protein H